MRQGHEPAADARVWCPDVVLGQSGADPEVLRVGSFWDQPYAEPGRANAELFDREANDLLSDLRALPVTVQSGRSMSLSRDAASRKRTLFSCPPQGKNANILGWESKAGQDAQ